MSNLNMDIIFQHSIPQIYQKMHLTEPITGQAMKGLAPVPSPDAILRLPTEIRDMVFNALVDQPHSITVALNQESIDAGALQDTFITNNPNKVDLGGCGLPSTGILTGFGPLYSLSQGYQQIGRQINE